MSRYRIKLNRQKESEKRTIRKRASRISIFTVIMSAIMYLLTNFISINIFADFFLVKLFIAIGSLIIIGIIEGCILLSIEVRRDKSLYKVDQWYHYRYRL